MNYYSPSTKGFYRSGIHTNMPQDVIQVADHDYVALLQGQSGDKEIGIVDNYPVLVDRAAPTPLTLLEERATLKPYRLAFRRALRSVSFPGFDHGLQKIEAVADAARVVDPFGDVSIWWDNVQQFIRTHPDVEVFRTNPVFYPDDAPMSEEKVDALFRLAQSIDDGAAPATIADLVADFEAEPWS